MIWTKRKLLILGMTYPSYSRKYVETVCTGAIDGETLAMVRIHPMPLRYLDEHHRFKNWQWITADCCPNDADPRPESIRINPDSVIVEDEIAATRAEERIRILEQSPHKCASLLDLRERQAAHRTSLGIVKPSGIRRVYLRKRPEQERLEWLAKEKELLSQQTIPTLRPPKPLDFPEVAFMVEWTDIDGTLHKMSLKQWGLHELYRKLEGDPARNSKVQSKMEKELDMGRRDVYFFLGNFRDRMYQFSLMDSYSPKRGQQTSLF